MVKAKIVEKMKNAIKVWRIRAETYGEEQAKLNAAIEGAEVLLAEVESVEECEACSEGETKVEETKES